MKALAKHYGHEIVWADRPTATIATTLGSPSSIKQVQLRSAFDGCDVLLLQRQTSPVILDFAHRAKQQGIAVLVEFDDSFHDIPASNPNSKVFDKAMQETMKGFIKMADHCIVSTPELKDAYSHLNENISVCYNAIDDEWFDKISPKEIMGEPQRAGQIRIGYAGSSTHYGDFQMIATPIYKILKNNPQVRMVFVGGGQMPGIQKRSAMMTILPETVWPQCEFFPGTDSDPTYQPGDDETKLASVRYYKRIQEADIDIHIAPLTPCSFNACKSELKAIQAGALGSPIVVSRFGPYKRYADEGPAGIVASCYDAKEWRSTLEALIGSAFMRKELASNNYNHVKRHHLSSHKVSQWNDVLQRVKTKERSNAEEATTA